MIVKTQIQTKTKSIIDNKDKVLIVCNSTSYYIHNGDNELVLLAGVDIRDGDKIATADELCSLASSEGTHLLIEAYDMDQALDYFNIWKSDSSIFNK